MKRNGIPWLLAALLAATGCGKKAEEKLAEKLIEKSLAAEGVTAKVDLSGETMSFTATDADGKQSQVRIAGDEMTIAGPDGQTTFRAGGAGKLPADFPADVVVYPGARIVTSMSYPGGANLALESADAPQAVVAHYASSMKDKGWAEKTAMDMEDMSMRTYAKDNRTANLIVQAAEGATSISLTVVTE